MNPQNDSVSNFGMPQPANDIGQLPPVQPPQAFHAPETAMPHFETATGPSPQMVQQPSMPMTQAQMQQPVAPPAQMQPSVVNMQPVADAPEEEPDTPLDEEWVEKAKAIVDRTRTDPFAQSRELSQLKAGYIKARYNKEIKAEG